MVINVSICTVDLHIRGLSHRIGLERLFSKLWCVFSLCSMSLGWCDHCPHSGAHSGSLKKGGLGQIQFVPWCVSLQVRMQSGPDTGK